MAKADKPFLGDRNTIRMYSGLRHRGHLYRRDSEVVVDRATAERILEENKGEIISIEFDRPLKMVGRPVDFRKL